MFVEALDIYHKIYIFFSFLYYLLSLFIVQSFQILAEIEKEITEAILNAISEDRDELPSTEEMDRLIASLENQKDLEQLASESNAGGRQKRLTVDFMGMQVNLFVFKFFICLSIFTLFADQVL